MKVKDNVHVTRGQGNSEKVEGRMVNASKKMLQNCDYRNKNVHFMMLERRILIHLTMKN